MTAFGLVKGDRLVLLTSSTLAVTLQITATVRYDNGKRETVQFQGVTDTTWVPLYFASAWAAAADGVIDSLNVSNYDVNAIRGQVMCEAFLWQGQSGQTGSPGTATLGGYARTKLGSAYVYNNHSLALGEFIEPNLATGATWVFIGTILNDGVTAGAHFYNVEPAARNEFEVLYGSILNGDAAAVTGQVWITDGTDSDTAAATNADIIANLLIGGASTIAAGIRRAFPTASTSADSSPASAGARFLVSGTMKLKVDFGSIAISQDTQFSVTCRIKGAIPTVAFSGPSGSTATTVTNAVF